MTEETAAAVFSHSWGICGCLLSRSPPLRAYVVLHALQPHTPRQTHAPPIGGYPISQTPPYSRPPACHMPPITGDPPSWRSATTSPERNGGGCAPSCSGGRGRRMPHAGYVGGVSTTSLRLEARTHGNPTMSSAPSTVQNSLTMSRTSATHTRVATGEGDATAPSDSGREREGSDRFADGKTRKIVEVMV